MLSLDIIFLLFLINIFYITAVTLINKYNKKHSKEVSFYMKIFTLEKIYFYFEQK